MLILLLALFNACEDDGIETSDCDSVVTVNPDKVRNGSSAFFSIISASITGNCLEVKYSSSGCDGKSWTEEMVADDLILESLPPQLGLRMLLKNEESCAAVFTKTVSFDLTSIQIGDYRDSGIKLNIAGFDQQLLYTYDNDSILETQIQKKWDLVNVNGGLAGVDTDFSAGSITWNFDGGKVTIENNNTSNAIYDGLKSGVYDYSIGEENDQKTLTVDGQNLGNVYILNKELVVDQRAVDGFQIRFKQHSTN
ncbi:MAG: hypothetical protein ABJG47_04110 [Ekhidna sp.]